MLPANTTLKNNLKNWLIQYKVVNDTIDILDAEIVNFGINYSVAIDLNTNRYTVISRANNAIRDFLIKNQYDIGESILITDFYKVLQKVNGIIDVVDLEIVGKNGASYASTSFNFTDNLSADGRRIEGKNNAVFELKFANIDIKGAIR